MSRRPVFIQARFIDKHPPSYLIQFEHDEQEYFFIPCRRTTISNLRQKLVTRVQIVIAVILCILAISSSPERHKQKRLSIAA